MKNRTIALMLLFACAICSQAKVRLPHILSNNMVLQQNSDARLWGWDQSGKTVKVTTSWNNNTYTAKTGKDGKWMVSIKTPKASYKPLTITFDDGEKTTLTNILSGEVWVCAGQSNMEMPVKGFGNCPVENYNEYVAEARQFKGIH
ncbi:MAG: 9-O-acetylesterase, partial [Prevotella sp.]|nr:9-O-acetylesterase [Prevotella sp.]